jgi:phosphoglycerate dehydrogenase-like enzyme
MNLLIIEHTAKEYEKKVRSKFPQVTIHAVAQEDEIGDFIEKADILLAFRISDDLMKRAKNLKWIQSLATGVDYMLNLPSLRKEVLLTSTRGIHGPQMSEIAFLHMLALNRNYPQVVRNQEREAWERWPGKLLYQKKIGIFGVGTIGVELAGKCKAFAMTTYGIDIFRRKLDCIDYFYGPEDILKVAAEVDYLIVVAPYTPETKNIINRKVFSAMKPTAFFINIGRGELVEEDALIDALNSGKIAGAALDAFIQEPLPKGHPFWKTKNLNITPHVGGMSDIYTDQALSIFEPNLQKFLAGERQNLINLIPR